MALVKGLHSGEYDTAASERLMNALILGRTQSIGDNPTSSFPFQPLSPDIVGIAGDSDGEQGRNRRTNSTTVNNYSCLSLERIQEEYLLTGDRNGTIHLYHLSSSKISSRSSSSSSSSFSLSAGPTNSLSSRSPPSYGLQPIHTANAPSLSSISPTTLSTLSSSSSTNTSSSTSSGSSSNRRNFSLHEQQQMHSSGVATIEWYTVDNGLFITGGYNNGLLTVWDTNTFQSVHSIPIGYSLSSSSSISSSSSSSSDSPSLSFTKPRMIYCTKMSTIATNHALVAVGTDQPGLQLIDLVSCSSIHTLQGHGDGIVTIDWHPSQEYLLVSGSLDGTIRLWDIRKNSKEACLMVLDQYKSLTNNDNHNENSNVSSTVATTTTTTGPVTLAHTGGVNSVHFSTTDSTGSTILSFGHDQRPRCWRIQQQASPLLRNSLTNTANDEEDDDEDDNDTNACAYPLRSSSSSIPSNGKHRHRFRYSWTGWNTVRSYISSLGIPRYLHRSNIPLLTAVSGYNETGILCIAGKHDQSSRTNRIPDIHLSASNQAGIIYVFDIESGELLTELKGHHSTITGLCYRKISQELYSCGEDGILLRWKPLLLQEKRPLPDDTIMTGSSNVTVNNDYNNDANVGNTGFFPV